MRGWRPSQVPQTQLRNKSCHNKEEIFNFLSDQNQKLVVFSVNNILEKHLCSISAKPKVTAKVSAQSYLSIFDCSFLYMSRNTKFEFCHPNYRNC